MGLDLGSIAGKAVGETFKSITDGLGGVVDRFITTSDEKNAFKLEMEKVLMEAERQTSEQVIAEYNSKKDIIVAELKQDDNYTKRARPSIVYAGLGVTIYNYCFIPTVQTFFGMELTQFDLPEEFWYTWGGVCGVYAWGRSTEKIKKK